MLVLVMRGIYEVQRSDGLRWHDIHTKFHDDWLGHLGNIKVIISTIWETVVLVLSKKYFLKYVVEIVSDDMTNGLSIPIILRVIPQSLEKL
jgi:uncharacterized protein involved in cysteine biosynthesis